MKTKIFNTFAKYQKSLIVVLFFLYWLPSLYVANIIVERGISLDTTAQYVYISVVAVLFTVAWYLLSKIVLAANAYAETVKGSDEAKAFTALSVSMSVLFVSLVATTFLNVFRISPDDGVLYENLTVIIYVFSNLLAAIYFYKFGTMGRQLAGYVKKTKQYLSGLIAAAIFVGGACIYAWTKITADSSSYDPTHILSYVNESVVLVFLFTPLVIGWIYGLAGTYGLLLFQKHTKGLIYKKSMHWLMLGILLLITVSSARNISDYLVGSASQVTLPDDISRVIALLVLLIASLYMTNRGLSLLSRIEQVVEEEK